MGPGVQQPRLLANINDNPPVPSPWRPPVQPPQNAEPAPPSQGIRRLPALGSRVFVSEMNGSEQASKLSQAMQMAFTQYFGSQLQVGGTRSDAQDYISQTTFTIIYQGTPVTGEISTIVDHCSGGHAYVLFDRSAAISRSMPAMMSAA